MYDTYQNVGWLWKFAHAVWKKSKKIQKKSKTKKPKISKKKTHKNPKIPIFFKKIIEKSKSLKKSQEITLKKKWGKKISQKKLPSWFSSIRRTRFDQSSPVKTVSESLGGPLGMTEDGEGRRRRTEEILVSNIGNWEVALKWCAV